MAHPPQNKKKYRSRKGVYDLFPSGDFMTLIADPQECYVTGLRLTKGQVIDTLLDRNWASGTRFRTEVRGETIEYEVSGPTLVKVNGKA